MPLQVLFGTRKLSDSGRERCSSYIKQLSNGDDQVSRGSKDRESGIDRHYQLVRCPVHRSDELIIQPPGTVKVSGSTGYRLRILRDRCVAPA